MPIASVRDLLMRAAAGAVAGVAIAFVDNVWSGGEVSPIIVASLALVSAAALAALWGRHAWLPAAIAWGCVPSAHLAKHLLGMPDTLHPNTYLSIVYLALFTAVVSVAGLGIGLGFNRLSGRDGI